MDNIVRTWEEIELTEAELEIIYGAVEAQNELLMTGAGTVTATLGGTTTDTDTLFGTVTKIVTSRP